MAMSSQEEKAFLSGQWVDVQSSNVASAMYEEDGGRLFVSFQNGRTYQYLGVPRAVAEGFARAPSHGKFVWDALRVRGTRDGSQYTFIEG